MLWIAVIVQMAVIFSFSMENAAESAGTSGGFIRRILEAISADFRMADSTVQHEIIESLSFFTRKAAHFSVFGLLGVLCASALLTYAIKPRTAFIVSSAICTLYAVSDEIHQYFVPGRACMIRDMVLDTAGSVCGALLTIAIARVIFGKGRKSSRKG